MPMATGLEWKWRVVYCSILLALLGLYAVLLRLCRVLINGNFDLGAWLGLCFGVIRSLSGTLLPFLVQGLFTKTEE